MDSNIFMNDVLFIIGLYYEKEGTRIDPWFEDWLSWPSLFWFPPVQKANSKIVLHIRPLSLPASFSPFHY
jgi:hypothetical protein